MRSEIPASAIVHGAGSFMEKDLPILYRTVNRRKPRRILELGTGEGLSTRTLASAAREYGGLVVTIDPAPRWEPGPADPNVLASVMTFEMFLQCFKMSWPYIYVDVDPHDYDQTTRIVEAFAPILETGGLMLFHDVEPARPEIQVKEAVEDWLRSKAGPGWAWACHPGDWGTGVLRKP